MNISTDTTSAPAIVPLVIRSVLGGTLMGLANLVPGISGGTMLLASGIYPRFVNAIAELTRFRFRFNSLLVLGSIVGAAAGAILLLAGVMRDMVVDHRWVMYSLFIGLTLGGVPIVWKMIRQVNASVWTGAALGFMVMAVVAVMQHQGAGASTGDERAGFMLLLFGGILAASAMILPGISGGYLLLVLGLYVPLLSAIDTFKDALRARDVAAAMDPAMHVLLPVGVGVIVGVVGASNLVRWLLVRFEAPTLGALLGLLVGAVIGLWPFQRGVVPEIGTTIKGKIITPELIEALNPKDYPTEFFTPTPGQIAAAVGLIVVGFLVTAVIARLGREKPNATNPAID